jgi:hypothetical protein
MTEVIVTPKPTTLRRIARSKLFLIIVALLIAAPVLWLTAFHSSAESPLPCDVEYDHLVKQAKQQLVNGDRTAAINSLIAARAKLRDCQPPTPKDVAPMFPN